MKNLRKFEDVVDSCANVLECKNCKYRIGCPIRPTFYLDDNEFETCLQISEIKTRQHFQLYGFLLSNDEIEEKSFNSYQFFRSKREKEIAEYPEYSVE